MRIDELRKELRNLIEEYNSGRDIIWDDFWNLVEKIDELLKLEEHNTNTLDDPHYKVTWEGKDVINYPVKFENNILGS